MALIAQHQQTSFSNPQAGQSPISAAVVRGNDNALVTKHNAHDADATVHVQTGLLSARPSAGTTGAMYMDENARLYRDDGATWGEIPYAQLAAASNTLAGDLAVEGALAVDGTTALNDDTAVTGDLDVSGTLTAGTWSGIPQSAVTDLVSDLSGKAAASHEHAGTDITSGTVPAARLPTSYPGLTFTATVVLSGAGSGPGTLNALLVQSGFINQGASTPTALGDAPVTGSGWAWMKVATNLGDGWMPILLT